jgi:chromosome segregation protein
MKLNKLRLLGFKSFVEPTDFQIEHGLTGVVGPNGCGKSNLVEALRWVMGETSHKSLRATGMDDVIFNGTNSRPARNNAEVTLFLDNADRSAPAQFNDAELIEVTRRIEREKGSAYRLNSREVRARDVQLLFADASTGARSPALVHQGRIGEIIQAKPEQRRRVLEEAAGVAGLHARRHEAELRLKAAETNLNRLEDVIGQLATQMEALKRQARQALKYRQVSADVRKAEATLFHLRWIAANAEVEAAKVAKDESIARVAEWTQIQAETATAQAVAAAALPPLRDEEAAASAALQRLVMAREQLDREEARVNERIVELNRRLNQFTQDIEREQRQQADAEAALERLATEEGGLSQDTTGVAEREALVAERVSVAEASLAEVERTFSELTSALADLVARRNQLDRALADHSSRLMRLEGQIAEVEVELASLEKPENGAPDLIAAAAAVEAAQNAVEQAEAASVRAEAAQSGARQALDVARGPATEADRRVSRLEAEAKALAKMIDVEAKKLWPPASDLLNVEKGYEAALGAALGDDLEAPVDPASPIRWAGAMAADSDPALPEGAEPLVRHVTAPAEMSRRLAQIGVVDRALGPKLVADLKPGQRLVSPEGDLWRWDGFAAASNAPTAAARRLAAKNRLADLDAELGHARTDAENKRRELEFAEAELSAAVGAESEARNARREAQSQADAARDKHAAAEREANRMTARLSALAEAKVRLVASRDEALAAKHDSSQALEALASAGELENQLAESRGEVSARRAVLAEARGEAQALAREAELRAKRLSAIAAERAEWERRRDGANNQATTIAQRSAEAQSERESLDGAPAAIAEQRRALIAEVEQADANRREASDRRVTAETTLAEADKAARAGLEAMGDARTEAARAEERLEAAARRTTDVAHEIREMLETEPPALAAMAEITAEDVLPPVGEVEERLDKLRRDRERLGAVNLRAEEELKEVETQHGSLVTERDDLTEAIKRLRQGIQSLNKEARERLLASFAVVNGHFQRLFTSLFGGGTAELQLIESDDPLEAGLDILAKPPGKKPASLSLLSGGEQALTAMALIFAVFLTNPAPICVLDEVDAPLDDHNVDRFCDLLDEMTRLTDTRFVIITHNPITMARMNRLFGVTMAERGISQLVSVDLEGAVKIRDAV